MLCSIFTPVRLQSSSTKIRKKLKRFRTRRFIDELWTLCRKPTKKVENPSFTPKKRQRRLVSVSWAFTLKIQQAWHVHRVFQETCTIKIICYTGDAFAKARDWRWSPIYYFLCSISAGLHFRHPLKDIFFVVVWLLLLLEICFVVTSYMLYIYYDELNKLCGRMYLQ